VRAGVRLILLLQVAALAVLAALALLGASAPLLAARAVGPGALLLLVAVTAVVIVAGGALILFRWVARPVERLLAAAERLDQGAAGLPALGPQGEAAGPGLTRAALAFERTAAALSEERARLAQKVSELERTNRELAQAREELFRTERLAAVGRLAAGIAHEVGNPLGAVQGYAELARGKLADGTADEAAVQDYLARIAAEARRIDAIVRDLLDFARPAALELRPVAVAAALDGAARLARVQGRFRDVTLSAELPGDLPPVRADERRLAQVFLNLLLNAADAMGGQGRIAVRGRVEAGEVRVEVEDTGPGIPASLLPRVFDPFFTTKEPGEGTGLGLAVCHGLLASMDGRIEATSPAGSGARLTLWLRAAEPA
jgi:signal transduction histidine kinase